MAVTYSAALKTARMQLVADMISGKVPAASTGAGAPGVLVIGTAALAGGAGGVLASLALPVPAGAAAASVMTIAGLPLDVLPSAAGVAAKAELRDNAGNVVVSNISVGGVAESTDAGKDIVLSASTIQMGVHVTINSAKLTHGV
jgi:hypothetical protein